MDIFAELKERLNIIDVLIAYGVQVDRHKRASCPLHDEKTPSFRVYPDTNSWFCFGCGAGGTVIDFVSRLFGLDLLHAAKKLDDDFYLGLLEQDLTEEEKIRIEAQRQERETDRLLVTKLEEWSDRAFDILCRCYWQMVEDMEKYAPKNADDCAPRMRGQAA